MDEEEMNEYEEAPSLFNSEEELDFEGVYDREEGHIYESIEEELGDEEEVYDDDGI